MVPVFVEKVVERLAPDILKAKKVADAEATAVETDAMKE